jgi:hypothetical protein
MSRGDVGKDKVGGGKLNKQDTGQEWLEESAGEQASASPHKEF